MKIYNFLITLFVLILFGNLLNGQGFEDGYCGTRCSAQEYDIVKNLQIAPFPQEAEFSYVRVQFFVISSSTNSTITNTDINNALNALNTKFMPSGVQFTHCRPPQFIHDATNAVIPYANTQKENDLGNKYDVLNAINVYILDDILPSLSGTGAAYTYLNGGTYDRIFISESATHGHFQDGLILSHEMGHFFGLLHTNGYSSSGTNELVNGTNCTTAGDLICDTPADPANGPMIISSQFNTCTYPNLSVLGSNPCSPPQGYQPFCDINGPVYQPLGNNLMFPQYCGSFNTFTSGQCQRVYSTYLTYHQDMNGAANLVIKDNSYDVGREPNAASIVTYYVNGVQHQWYDVWESPNIINCRQINGGCQLSTFQNPGYLGGGGNRLIVRVENNGCNTNTDASAKLHMYWTLGSTGEDWANAWTTDNLCGLPAGREIINPATGLGGIAIPALNGGNYVTLSLPWTAPNPNNYTCLQLMPFTDGNPAICFLSRIVSVADGMYNEQVGPIRENVMQNNNIATRNTSLVPLSGIILGSVNEGNFTLFAHNFYANTETFDLELRNQNPNHNFIGKGNIILKLDNELWNAWVMGGEKTEGIIIWNKTEHKLKITDNQSARLQNIALEAGERREIAISFYLNEVVSEEEYYKFVLSQKLSIDSVAVGSSCVFEVSINDNTINTEQRLSPLSTKKTYFSVAPNPYANTFTVSYSTEQEGFVGIELWDATGRKISTLFHERQEQGEYNQVFEPQEVESGVYYLIFTTGESQSYKKLIHIQK